MPNTIRSAVTGDIPLLVDLMEEFHGESGRPLDRAWAAAGFSALLGDNSLGAVWIASSEGRPGGYVVLTLRFTMEFGGLDAFIDDLYVRPSCRRRGMGQALLGALFSDCEKRGALAVHVEAGHDNLPALGLYGSRGMRAGTDGRLMLTVELGRGAPSGTR